MASNTKVGFNTFDRAVREIWEVIGGRRDDLEVHMYRLVDRPYATRIDAGSSSWRTAEDAVDEAWERNRKTTCEDHKDG